MHFKNNYIKWTFLLFLIAGLFFYISGKLLDKEAERVIQQLYVRDSNGVIKGVESITIKKNNANALVLVHGFLETPDTFRELINEVSQKTTLDIYAPLLPFHGRNLQTAAQLDNQTVLDYLQGYLGGLSKQYKTLTVVGLSYGGALLVDLASKGKLPANVNLVLYAPSIYGFTDLLSSKIKRGVYGLWRNYCNYPAFGCQFPVYESGDAVAATAIANEINLRYKVNSAVTQLAKLDMENRENLTNLKRPFSLIIAKDDNRVSYEKLKNVCEANKTYCHFYSFPSGKHVIHMGANKEAFTNLIIQLTNNKP